MEKRLFIFFFGFFFFSCLNNPKEVQNEDLLLKEELEKIDWSSVDAYPSIDECDSLLTEAEKKQCFFEFINTNLQERLHIDTLVVACPQIDTLQVLVTIFPNAKTSFDIYNVPDSLKQEYKEIDSIIQLRLKNFPEINPALKRGIPVKTQFIVPVILKVD